MRVEKLVSFRLGPYSSLLVLLSSWVGCGADASEDAPGLGPVPSNGGYGYSASGGFGTIIANGGSGGSAALPPEVEVESSFKLPVLSGRWVWSANPTSGRVAVIDTRSLQVDLVTAGFAPTYLAPLPATGEVKSAAIVLNTRSNDASLMRLTPAGFAAIRVPTHAGANAWSVSPSGRWAIAWSDASTIKDPDPADSFQDITVIDVASQVPIATRLSVGYRPSRIFFQDDESHAFVISEPGVSVLELGSTDPRIERDVALTATATEKATDVSVVPDGSYALYRVDGSPRLGIVELSSGARTEVTLSGPVTDLDLVEDGTSAIAVVRGGSSVSQGQPSSGGGGSGGTFNGGARESLTFAGGGGSGGIASDSNGGLGTEPSGGIDPAPVGGTGGESAGSGIGGELEAGADSGGAGGTPGPSTHSRPSEVAVLSLRSVLAERTRYDSVFLEDVVGSVAVSAQGNAAVLYTTIASLDRITVMGTDRSTNNYLSLRPVPVRAPVEAVFIAPDAAHALVTLRTTTGSSIGGAFAIVPLDEALSAKIQPTDAAITGVAFAPAEATSAILTAAKGHTAYLVHMPVLRVDAVPLPSLPLAAGIVSDENVGYVIQDHPDGRLSLLNLETGEPRTLTGFELAGGVSDGN